MSKRVFRHGIRPIRVLPLGFSAVILVGTLLLTLPVASAAGEALPFWDALFTATSATCVTGLVVVDTGTFFSPFGQAVILCLIQLGGLGFMTLAAILFMLLGRRISLKERMTLAESLGENRLQGIVKLGRNAVLLTLFCELAGAALLTVRFVPRFGFGKGLWYAVFHAVSAFCNAGFDLLGNYQSLTGYVGDPLINLTIMGLIVTGGLGFAVLLDIGRGASKHGHVRRFAHLRLHTKLVLTGTALLLIGGAALILLFEWDNPPTLGALPAGERVLASVFQSVTLRTAGFNSIDQLALRDASKFAGIVLMMAGGAPTGTAGGLKITTFAVMLLTVRAQARGRRDVTAFGRRFSSEMVRRALCILTIGIAVLCVSVTAISLMELSSPAGAFGFLNELYEATSALCTVGVSVGVTQACGFGSRICLIAMMFMGRVGLLTLALSLTGGQSEAPLRYPEEDILIG